MLTFIDVKFIFNRLFIGKFKDKQLLRAENILQLADVVRRVVFLPFLLYFHQIVRLFVAKILKKE